MMDIAGLQGGVEGLRISGVGKVPKVESHSNERRARLVATSLQRLQELFVDRT